MRKLEELEGFIGKMSAAGFQEIELELDGIHLVLKKNGAAPQKTVAAAETAASTEAAGTAAISLPELNADGIIEVVSPVLGTFYRAAEPGAEPFIKLGDKVSADTVVGIVEVMKLFNEVEAGSCGEIVEIMAEDGAMVEYGQPLFRIRTV